MRGLALTGVLLCAAVATAQTVAGQHHKQLTYTSSGKKIVIELFTPSTPGKHPGVILLYGGVGMTTRADQFRVYCADLTRHGYVVLLPHYLDATGTETMGADTGENFARWLAAVHDAVTFGVQNQKLEPRIGMVGFSLGAFLALANAATDPRVAVLVEYYGGISDHFPPSAGKLPPTLILHGENDRTVPVSQARALAARLEQEKVPYEMKIYRTAGHVFDGKNGDPVAGKDAWKRTLSFLNSYLEPAR